jgi:predicted MFS family arabinose efflux permease
LILVIASGGSLLLDRVGLGLGFVFNSLSYLVAAACLYAAKELGRSQPATHSFAEFLHHLPAELWAGFVYLFKRPGLILPIALTFATVALVMPMTGLLAAIVHAQGGSIVSLGLLGAASGFGALLGALYAGWRSEGSNAVRLYGIFGLLSAAALAFFAATPVGWLSALPLAVVGFALFTQAVWNTSRVRLQADPAYQARLQSLTTMAFTLAGAAGMAWGGVAIDQFGMPSLFVAAGLLAVVSLLALVYKPDS